VQEEGLSIRERWKEKSITFPGKDCCEKTVILCKENLSLALKKGRKALRGERWFCCNSPRGEGERVRKIERKKKGASSQFEKNVFPI